MIGHLSFTCVHAAAVDRSGTECGYGESVNRQGVTETDIGKAVLSAFQRLNVKTKGDEEEGDLVILRFSYST